MSLHALGYRADDAAGLQKDRRAAERLLAAAPPPPPAFSLEQHVPSILDQGALSSCVGQAVARAIQARLSWRGVRSPSLVSRLFVYYLARAYEGLQHLDVGCQIRNAFAGITRYGYPPEDLHPYSDRKDGPSSPVFQMPPASAFRAAFDARLMSYERIDSEGDQRVVDCRRAIASGHLVVFGTDVTESFSAGAIDARRPLPPPRSGEAIAGGHSMVLASYDAAVGGFRSPNSWGPAWGDSGWWWMSDDYVRWGGTRDLWIVERVVEPVST